MEPSRSTLYRTFLLFAIGILLLLGFSLRMPGFLAMAASWSTVLIGAWGLARRPLTGIRAERRLYPNAFEGDEVSVEIILESGRRASMIELADSFGPSIAQEHRMLDPGPVEPGVPRRLRYVAYCSRQWGIHAVGPLQVMCSDPAGLFRARKTIPAVGEFAVFPQVYDVQGLGLMGAQSTLIPQEASEGRSGQSLTAMGVREYRTGDDLRRIHWPATARRGFPMVKEFETDLRPHFSVFVDLYRRYRAGMGRKSTLEYVLRTAASAVWSAIRSGGVVQMEGLGVRPLHVPPGQGESHLTFSLHELIRAEMGGTVPLQELVLRSLSLVPSSSTVVMVSGTVYLDLLETGRLLEALRSRGVRVAMFLINQFSFPAISGWPPPRAEIVEKRREVTFFLLSRGIQVRILEASDDLEAALGEGWPS